MRLSSAALLYNHAPLKSRAHAAMAFLPHDGITDSLACAIAIDAVSVMAVAVGPEVLALRDRKCESSDSFVLKCRPSSES